MNLVRTEFASARAAEARATLDSELMRSVAHGDRRAMHELYSAHNVRVYRYVLGMVREPVIAEDVVSEVFLDVWRQADRFQGRSSVSTWLLGIARHKALSAIRPPSTEVTVVSDPDAAKAVVDQSKDPEVVTHDKRRAAVVRRCMNSLGVAQAEIINLVYYQGKTVKEISQIAGVPECTVRTRMFYARKQLEKFLRLAGVDSAAV
jgi:RNA polymerase sigma-70 factor (ECF subfamily)